MDPLHRVAVLNNIGVQMLEMKNVFGAIQVFQQAVHVIKELTVFVNTPPINVPPVADIDAASIVQPLKCLLPSTLNDTLRLSSRVESLTSSISQHGGVGGTKSDTKGNDDYYYIYDRVLTLPLADVSTIDVDLNSYMFNASAVIIFNLCVSCHQHGKQCGQTTATISLSLRLYELAVHMMQRASSANTDSIFFEFVMCLTLNNMASIYYHDLCNYQKGIYCMEYIKKILIRSIAAGNDMDEVALEFMHGNEWNNIKLNAVHAELPSAAKAA